MGTRSKQTGGLNGKQKEALIATYVEKVQAEEACSQLDSRLRQAQANLAAANGKLSSFQDLLGFDVEKAIKNDEGGLRTSIQAALNKQAVQKPKPTEE